jgi:tripartite-type tricarboxylate transporter receptor subunit TctC
MKMDKKPLLVKTIGMLITVSILFMIPAALSAAADYPSRPVRLIIPWPPGGWNDIVGRLIAAKLSERLGKQVVAENHAGAGGVIGTEMVSKAEPDGYTLLIIASSYAINAAFGKTPYDPVKSFSPISKVGEGPFMLVATPSAPASTVKELIALAKQKPGQLVFSLSGAGSGPHMASELFKYMAGVDYKSIQFKGGGPALVDLLGGHSQFQWQSLIALLPQIKAGKIKVLATSSARRIATLPDVPTVAEAGVPGYAATQWSGMLAPAGTPAPIIDRLNREFKAIMANEEVKKRFEAEGADPDYLGTAEFGQFVETELAKWAQVVKHANIKLEE